MRASPAMSISSPSSAYPRRSLASWVAISPTSLGASGHVCWVGPSASPKCRCCGLLNVGNILLGSMQGVTWGVNIICLMDILGPQGRGMASALSNAVGYAGSALAAPLAAHIVAVTHHVTICLVALAVSTSLGLLISALAQDTQRWAPTAKVEDGPEAGCPRPKFAVASETQALCSLAGYTLNCSTALVWGAALIWIKGPGGFSIEGAGALESWFTANKVAAMLMSGCVSYYCGRPQTVAAASLCVVALGLSLLCMQAHAPPAGWPLLLTSTAMIGLGTGGAYPALAAAVTQGVPDASRASVYGAYRMWRDFGYAGGGFASRMNSSSFERTSLLVCVGAVVVAVVFCSRLVLVPLLRRRGDEASDGRTEMASPRTPAAEGSSHLGSNEDDEDSDEPSDASSDLPCGQGRGP